MVPELFSLEAKYSFPKSGSQQAIRSRRVESVPSHADIVNSRLKILRHNSQYDISQDENVELKRRISTMKLSQKEPEEQRRDRNPLL
jgi:hypothetical protein